MGKIRKSGKSEMFEIFVDITLVLTLSIIIIWLGLIYEQINSSFEIVNAAFAVFGGVLTITQSISRLYKNANKYREKKSRIDCVLLKNEKISSFGLFIAAALQKPAERDFALGCLEERFAKDVKKHGSGKAKKLFWIDISKTIIPAIWKLICRIVVGMIINKIIPK